MPRNRPEQQAARQLAADYDLPYQSALQILRMIERARELLNEHENWQADRTLVLGDDDPYEVALHDIDEDYVQTYETDSFEAGYAGPYVTMLIWTYNNEGGDERFEITSEIDPATKDGAEQLAAFLVLHARGWDADPYEIETLGRYLKAQADKSGLIGIDRSDVAHWVPPE